VVENARSITGVFHVSIGMEASAAALACVRESVDTIMLSHRNHGHLAAIGSDLELLYRELLGRDGGLQRGRAGSLHLADPERGVPYTSAMLGSGAALAAGLALARRRRGTPGVVFAFFGDGAMGEGIVYETFNLCAAWRLPVLFVCENNAPAGGEGRLARLASAHGVHGEVVNGRIPRQVLAGLDASRGRVRDGTGPQFLEVGSEPWPGNATFIPHAAGQLDPLAAEEAPQDAFAAGDPVLAEARRLLSEGVSLTELLALDERIAGEARSAFEAAATAPLAPAWAALEGVWAS
jgi:TPP-dependent pyruvate/acetoin dehydrogenase alpha subunit